MKLWMLLVGFCMVLVTVYSVAGQFLSDDDINMLNNDVINASDGNFTRLFVNGVAVATSAGGTNFNVSNGSTIDNVVDNEIVSFLAGNNMIVTQIALNFTFNSTGADTSLNGTSAGGDLGGSYPDPTVNRNITINSSGSVDSTALTDGGTISFDWVDAEVADTLTIDSSSSIDKGALDNSGTLGFDWADSEVSNTLTCSNVVSSVAVVDDVEVFNNITINASGSVTSTALIDGGTIGFDWVDAEVADTLTIDSSSSIDKGALDNSGTATEETTLLHVNVFDTSLSAQSNPRVPLLSNAPLLTLPEELIVKSSSTLAFAILVPVHTPVVMVPTVTKAGKEVISSVPLILVQSGVLIVPVTFKSPVTLRLPFT